MSVDIVLILTAGATFAMAFILISRYVCMQVLTLRE
jgi:hypothetical protein